MITSKNHFYLTEDALNSIKGTKKNNGYLLTLKDGEDHYPIMSLEAATHNGRAMECMGGCRLRSEYESIEIVPYNRTLGDEDAQRQRDVLFLLTISQMRTIKPLNKFLSLNPQDHRLYARVDFKGTPDSLKDITDSISLIKPEDIDPRVKKEIKKGRVKIDYLVRLLNSPEQRQFTHAALDHARKEGISDTLYPFFFVGPGLS